MIAVGYARVETAAPLDATDDQVPGLDQVLVAGDTGNDSSMFVTFLLASFEPATGQLTYVRAGHIPPFRRNGSGSTRLQK